MLLRPIPGVDRMIALLRRLGVMWVSFGRPHNAESNFGITWTLARAERLADM